MRQVLVTTGATVTFEALIRSVLWDQFLDRLALSQYDRLIVQYGKSEGSIEFVRKLVDEFGGIQEYDDKDTGHNFEFTYGGKVWVRCIQFDSLLIEHFTSQSELVISHAGTGSIIDTLRVKDRDIKLIVMINEGLKDNHQVEIAEAFKSLGVLDSVGSNGEELLEAVEKAGRVEQKRLPESNGGIVERIIVEELM